ncbi:two-component sensor histidine kinase [Dietzia sp. HMSC21D01]|uniref:Sensor histidine kinase n=1 Tax=Dietzia cinnamea TaxID=321318 RepID=A0AAW5QDF4_9ACTN|nr:sensor histidine kinase [Dietzia cinnamea]OFS17668.1 two-component sensor histidine kinase [Dietzia sp. HMSC21D01]MBM7231897.1 sensor histidine kinase [Dietzia cinnamea]MCT2034860.1 sensor histidine kinase [Dietzia cinnamea]MCT2111116.1 sensor histidine kinase [Dietzia cinnamea]MCT2118987.1 sensor histidine kinase [Dietzia cinnamea]
MTSEPTTAAELPPESAGVRVVFTQLQIALHTLVAALLVLTLVGAHSDASGVLNVPAAATAAGFAAVYCIGTVWERRRETASTVRLGWLAAVLVLWAALVVQVPEAAYLVFPLFFLAQFLLGVWTGAAAVAFLAAVAVLALGLHEGFTAAGIIGPVVGALVALGLGAGVRALHRESQARRAVIAELMATRSELAAREREVGREAERARLAGEIHDTVAQGLSSIGMLLHAAERSDPSHPAVEQIRLAREVAGENLTETRRLIAALRPAPLDGVSLAGALRRIAERVGTENPGLAVSVGGDPTADPPAELSAVLVRVTQEALTNAVKHGSPDQIRITLDHRPTSVQLEVHDDGCGFDTTAPRTAASFGLDGMARRVDDLGGTLEVESEVGGGTSVRAVLPTGTTEKEL